MTVSAFGVVHNDISKALSRGQRNTGLAAAGAGLAGGALYLGTRGHAGAATHAVTSAAQAAQPATHGVGTAAKVGMGAAGLGLAAGAARFARVTAKSRETTGLSEGTRNLMDWHKGAKTKLNMEPGSHRAPGPYKGKRRAA